jgi:hypothetical protein
LSGQVIKIVDGVAQVGEEQIGFIEDDLDRVISINGQDKIPARCIHNARIAEVMDNAIGASDPTVLMGDMGPLREARFDQHADLI